MGTIEPEVDIADVAATPGAVPLDVGAPVVATPAPAIWRCDICGCTITTKGDGRMEAAHLAGKPHLKKLRALGLAPALESRKPARQACSTSVGPSSIAPPTPWLAQGGAFLLPCGHTRYSWQGGRTDVVPPGHTPFSWGTFAGDGDATQCGAPPMTAALNERCEQRQRSRQRKPRPTVLDQGSAHAAENSTAAVVFERDGQPAEFRCKYCSRHLSSRNQLYKHYREVAACGEQAVALEGADLEARRPRALHKVALLVGYADGDGASVAEHVRAALQVLEGAVEGAGDLPSLTRATDVVYRRSELLRHTTMPAVEDVFVYSSGAADEELDADDQARAAWLAQLNAQLHPHSISVLERERLHPDLHSLNAEQRCSVREHVLLLPWAYLSDEEPPASLNEVEAFASRLKAVLRAVLPPKTVTGAGFRKRRSEEQNAIRALHRWHNFTVGASTEGRPIQPTDSACQRIVDRFWLQGRPTVSRAAVGGRPYVRLHVNADALLEGQLEAMVGTAVCVWRGWLPREFPVVALDPTVVLRTPALPAGLGYLRRARFDWEAAKQALFRKQRAPLTEERLAAFEAALVERIASSAVATEAATRAWLEESERHTCPAILRTAERLGLAGRLGSAAAPLAASGALTALHTAGGAAAADDEHGVEHGAESLTDAPAVFTDAPAVFTDAPAVFTDAPAVYADVLRLLRHADRSGLWPSTSLARARILSVEDPNTGGSFSLLAPQKAREGKEGTTTWHATTRGNALFEELVHATFALEHALMPDRPPSTRVAVNRRALFRPHTDAGSGFGQSTSLIVGLGDYSGGELVVEGEPSDIRYKPLQFDGWRQRHWTLPFEGERFSLVWFTPNEA